MEVNAVFFNAMEHLLMLIMPQGNAQQSTTRLPLTWREKRQHLKQRSF